MNPSLSVVIVNWNGAEELRRCLSALRAQGQDDLEMVIVDNGSADDSLDVARRSWPEAVIVSLAENVGFAEGCNRGIAVSRGEWVLTLNNDTEVRPGFVAALRNVAANADADVGMFQTRVVLRDQGRLNSTGVVVYRDGSANDRDFGAPLSSREEPDEVMCVTAGAGLYRRAMLEAAKLEAGYFDPSFFMYFEDVDLGWRCRLAGWRALYVPGAVVEHAFQSSSRKRGRHFVTIQCMQNRVRTLLKNASLRLILRSLPRTASDFLWLMQHAGGSALRNYVRAVNAGARQRADVTGLARESRSAIERRWIARRAEDS